MSNDGQSNDDLKENSRASEKGQASGGQSRETSLASDEDESSWTRVLSKSKKRSQSQVQNETNTGAPGASSAQRLNNSNPTTGLGVASPSYQINSTRRGSSSSQPGSQSNSRNPVILSAANSSQVRGPRSVPQTRSSAQPRGELASQGSQPSSHSNRSNQSSSQNRSPSSIPSSSAPGCTSFNTQNNPVDLCCNHFEVKFRKQPLPTVHLYTVTIYSKRYSFSTQDHSNLSQVKSRGLKLKIFDVLRKGNPELNRCAYDGVSTIYSARLLSDILNEPKEVLPRNVNPDWRPENRAETLRQPELLVYEVTITQSQSNPREGSSFPSQRTNHGDPGPDDKTFLEALSVFLLDSSSKSKGVQRRLCVRPNYYSRPLEENARKIGNNLVVWEGFHSSFRLTYAAPNDQVPRLVLNYSDVMTAVLVSKPVEGFIREFLRTNYGPIDIDLIRTKREARDMVNTALSGVLVQTTCGKHLRKYTIRELTAITSIDHSFQVTKRKQNGEIGEETVNVSEHFRSQHDYTLLHPEWPLLCMKGRPRENGGLRENGPVYIPIEVCTILDGQRYMRFSPDERSKFLKLGKTSPGRKKANIENSLNSMAATYEAHNEPFGETFGIQIQRSMMNVQGQVLAAPTLYFQNSLMNSETSKDGRWNFKDRRMVNPVKLEAHEWAVYVFYNGSRTEYNEELKTNCLEHIQGGFLFESLSKMLKKMGMVVNGYPRLDWESTTRGNPDERIQRMLDIVKLPKNLIVAVLPSKSPELYVPLKKICETTTDGRRTVITQCVIMGKSTSLSDQHLANLALKINLKMGGSNSDVELKYILGSKPTCIFGIDVSHGSTEDTDKPSIAAVVASVEDNQWSRYAPQVREQDANVEKVQDLQKMVTDLLREFRRNVGKYPGQIIVYRDGISESQFETVGRGELGNFEEACKGVYGDNKDLKIPITFIIVQKRHHTRFFKRKKDETFENMQPGTVVTSQVCQTQNEDFYLCSHRSFITDSDGSPGVTSRPAHYTVYSDEINLGQANIHNLTNHLCYCFGRATTAVSIPAPVYYAHVAAKHYSYFLNRDAAGGATLRDINDKLKNASYRMFYI